MKKLRAEVRDISDIDFRFKMYNIFLGEKYLYSLPEYSIIFKDDDSIEVIEDELNINVEDAFSLITGKKSFKIAYRCNYSKHLVTPYKINPL